MHVQVCTLDECCEHQRTHLLTRSLQDASTCALMHVQFVRSALGERGWGGSTSLGEHVLLGVGGYF